MSCLERKFGHSSKKRIDRKLESADTLLKTVKMNVPAQNVNLVIDKPIFLIGGDHQPYDQGQLGSCTANALAFAFVYNAVKQGYVPFMPSRLDIYYNERINMGIEYLQVDEGANISDCEFVLENIGVLPEKSWPYLDDYNDPSFYTVPTEATDDVRTLALSQNTMYTVDPTNLNSMKLILTNGYPLIAGILVDLNVFCSQTTAFTGIITKAPNIRSGNIGGHAVVIVGYTNDDYFIIRNSWGINWGLGFFNQSSGVYNYDEYNGKMRGYFKVPFSYIQNKQITSELYACKEINNTLNTINSTLYTITPCLDLKFKSENVIKPLGTYYSNLTIPILKLKIDFYYYFNPIKNKYIWCVRSIKTNSKPIILNEFEVTNLNCIENINILFYNKSKLSQTYVKGSCIAMTKNNKICTVLSLNIITGKISVISSITL